MVHRCNILYIFYVLGLDIEKSEGRKGNVYSVSIDLAMSEIEKGKHCVE